MKTLVLACLLTCGGSYAQGADAVESAYQAVLPEFTQTAYLAVVPAPYKTDYFVRVTPTGYDQLWLPPPVIAPVLLHRGRNFFGMLRSEFPRRPQFRELIQVVLVPALWRACIAQKELDRKLDRLAVANVHYPHPVRAVLQRQIHLLLNLRNRNRVQPLIRTRAADIVKVVIDSRSP